MIKKSVNFIRTDIEGDECGAIDGMVKIFEKAKLTIKLLIEVHSYLYDKPSRNFKKRLVKLDELGFKAKYIVSAGVTRPQKVIDLSYKPIAAVKEGNFTHGLYKYVKMKHLLEFIRFRPKIIRGIF